MLSYFQKICNTIDSNQVLREAEECEKETSVNDEEMAERLVRSCIVMLVCNCWHCALISSIKVSSFHHD